MTARPTDAALLRDVDLREELGAKIRYRDKLVAMIAGLHTRIDNARRLIKATDAEIRALRAGLTAVLKEEAAARNADRRRNARADYVYPKADPHRQVRAVFYGASKPRASR